MQAVSNHYAGILSKDAPGFKTGAIELNAHNNLGRGYEVGAILAKRYVIANLDDDVLAGDLRMMLGQYDQLKSLVGDSVLNVELDIDADSYDNNVKEFQKEIIAKTNEQVDEKIIEELLRSTKTYPRKVRERLIRQVVRNKKIANLIKQKYHYICSVCGREPFIQKNGQPYAEADHIIPLNGNTKGDDSVENLRCLCAQCHAVITHGSSEEITKLISLDS